MMEKSTIRRRFSFDLCTFFVALTVVCLVFGVLGRPIGRSAVQRSVIDELVQRGHQVAGLSESYLGMPNTYSVYLNEANGDDLAIVSRLPGVVALYSAASQFGDDGFTQLRRLKTLRVLSIAKATITDRSLKNIAALPKLESLHLSDTLITEDGLQRLSAKLPSCSIEYKTSTQRNSGRNGTKAALFDTPFPALHNM